jgi:hypothetical protein
MNEQAIASEHRQAMDLAHEGKFHQAAWREHSAARMALSEPTRTVLYRSAIQLYVDGKADPQALECAAEWLIQYADHPEPAAHPELKAEIADILRAIADRL